MLKTILSAFVFSLAASAASGTTLIVAGTDAIYGAGLGGNGTSTAPQEFAFSPADGNFFEFSSVTGLVGCCGGLTGNIGPDGSAGQTTINPLNGISGISVGRRIFLAGVFVNSAVPPTSGNEPASLSYGGSLTVGDATFSPLLNQAFFIGDGLTGTASGSTQKFFAPNSADTLLLGLIDGFGFSGNPSYYGDNPGSFTATLELKNANPPVGEIPLPAAGFLLAGAFGGLGMMRRRRKS